MIIVDHPPNFERIRAAFPDAIAPGVIFAYGEHIYNPSGKPIPHALLAHEAVHQARQVMGGIDGPTIWWNNYLVDPEFRYGEELLAHAAELMAQLPGLDRNQKHKLLMSTAARLVAPLYNYQPPRQLRWAIDDLSWSLST